ncbi:HAMP domain-containing protein [Candidatus Woesearchaeota archaeon]|nr:HAMP domain-containing protein [Candidatus Woesearchaeota archaeon]
MKISQKLLLGFFGVIFLVGIMTHFSITTSQKALQKSIGESSIALAVEMLDKIDRDIFNRIERWEAYTHTNPRLKETILSCNQEFEKLDNIQRYINEEDQKWISAPKEEITPFMEKLINNVLSQRLRERMNFYEEKYGYRVFGEVFVTNKYGVNVAQTGKTSDYRQDDEEWWQNAKRDGLYIADIEYDRSAGVYSTDVGIRIDDENGNFIGVMKVVLNIEEVINIIKELESSGMHAEHKTMHFKLLNKEGKFIYSTKEFEFFENVYDELLTHFLAGEHTDYFIAMGDEPGEGEELFAYAHSKGYKDFKGLDWVLVVEYDTEEIFAPVINLRNSILILLVISLIVAVTLSILISISISRPITHLRDASVKIGKGELDTKIEIKSKDEIGELASAFSKMTGDLKQSHVKIRQHEKELEVLVEKRTKELNQKVKELEKTRTAILNMLEDVNLSKKELEKSQKELLRLNKELEKANVELRRVDKYKNEFISITAHELKTPLASIHGFASLLQKKKIASNVRQRDNYLKIILEDTERLKKHIDDIFDLSKLDLGTMKFFFERVSIKNVFKELVKELYLLAAKKGIVLKANVANNIPQYINTDKSRLFQILTNLVNNAIKYTPRRGGKIVVSAYKSSNNVLFIVKDSGIGIAEKHFSKIFERFYQVDSSYTRKTVGSGLGLAICKGVVGALGGEMRVKSKPGKGSAFSFTLPVKGPAKGEEELRVFKKVGRETKIRKPELTKKLKKTTKSK